MGRNTQRVSKRSYSSIRKKKKGLSLVVELGDLTWLKTSNCGISRMERKGICSSQAVRSSTDANRRKAKGGSRGLSSTIGLVVRSGLS